MSPSFTHSDAAFCIGLVFVHFKRTSKNDYCSTHTHPFTHTHTGPHTPHTTHYTLHTTHHPCHIPHPAGTQFSDRRLQIKRLVQIFPVYSRTPSHGLWISLCPVEILPCVRLFRRPTVVQPSRPKHPPWSPGPQTGSSSRRQLTSSCSRNTTANNSNWNTLIKTILTMTKI